MSHISPVPGHVNSTGASIPSGYIGEQISATVLYNNRVDVINTVSKTILSLPITTVGYYEVTGFIGVTNIDNVYIQCGYSTSAALPTSIDRVQIRRLNSGISSISSVALDGKLLNALTPTTLNLNVFFIQGGATAKCWGSLTAVRIL
jgi:hypothetical protein